MSVDPTKLAALLATLKPGKQAVACEYLRVEWNNGSNTAYYATDAYSRLTPFRDVRNHISRAHIQAKIIGDGFQQFEISGDIRTDAVAMTFEDGDGAIKALFKTYGSARVELFRYYPVEDLLVSIWWGQIIAPQRQGRFTFKCQLKNGYRSKERFLPNLPRPSECPFTFGALLDTADKVACNGCPYDKHLGGSVGNFKTGTMPFLDCPKTRAACTARLGTDSFYGGVDVNALPTETDRAGAALSQTKGNGTIRNKPLAWGFGTKYYGGAEVLLWGQEFNSSHPTQGFVRGLWPLFEGPVAFISDVEVDGAVIGFEHINTRNGTRGQSPTAYPGTTQSFSSTALVFARKGPVDPNTYDQSRMTLRVLAQLYSSVAVFTDPTTFTRIWTDDVIWCLIEMYTNQKCGLGYEHSRFNIAKAITASQALLPTVTMTLTKADGETLVFAGRRATFDAVLAGKPADEQILDICRAARISPPFQEDGKYSIAVLKQFSAAELAAAPVFKDYGPDRNIVFTGPESVVFDSIADDKLPNELTVTFDESTNFDIARPIVGNDPDQQRKASQVAGNQARNVVPKQLGATGIRNLHQAGRLLYHNLYFGDFESGGTMNNATAQVVVPFEWVYAVTRYGPLQLDLQNAIVPDNPTTDAPYVYWRVTGIKAADKNTAVISVAAYNKEFYESIEAEPAPPTSCTIDADCGVGEMCVGGICVPTGGGGGFCTVDMDCPPETPFCVNGVCMVDPGGGGGCLPDISASYNAADGTMDVDILPC